VFVNPPSRTRLACLDIEETKQENEEINAFPGAAMEHFAYQELPSA
jgi:hypothetical protein